MTHHTCRGSPVIAVQAAPLVSQTGGDLWCRTVMVFQTILRMLLGTVRHRPKTHTSAASMPVVVESLRPRTRGISNSSCKSSNTWGRTCNCQAPRRRQAG